MPNTFEAEPDLNVSISELAEITKTKRSQLYELSRQDRLPGMFRVGRLVRVHLPAFFHESQPKADSALSRPQCRSLPGGPKHASA